MRINRTKRNAHAKQLVFDTLAALCGLAIIILGIFVFMDPRERSYLFPVIFLLAAVFQIIAALPGLTAGYGKDNNRRRWNGVALCFFAILLIAIAVISAICLWR